MSGYKKMVAFDSSSYEDHRHHMARRFKHQALFQDYMDLHQETEAARNNLMALKKKQLMLQAEVRFLRQRHKFLLKNKSSTSQEQVFIKQLTQSRKSTKGKLHFKKQTTSHNFPYAEKKKAPRSILSADFDSILEKQQSVQRVVANQRVRVTGPKAPSFHDLNQKDDIFGSQELMGQNRKPVIDLNQICREDLESQSRCRPFDSLTKGLIGNGLHEHHRDVQFSIGRNLGGGSVLGNLRSDSSGRAKKRKISWQDPVAVTVGSR